RLDDDTFKLAASLAQALAGTAKDLLSAGALTGQAFERAGVRAREGAVEVTALDDSSIRADAGGFAVALSNAKQSGTSVGVAIGAAVAVNNIGGGSGRRVKAYIEASTVNAAGDVELDADSTASIGALTMGG